MKSPLKREKKKASLRAMLAAAHKRIQNGEGIPEEEFWKKVEANSRKRRKRKTPA